MFRCKCFENAKFYVFILSQTQTNKFMPFEQNGDILLPCKSILDSGYEGYAIRYEFHSKVLVDKENKEGGNNIENILYGEAT